MPDQALVIILVLQEYLCCSYGWSYRCLHIVVGVVLVTAVGTAVGLFEPRLVDFIMDRLPTDNPVTKMLLASRAGAANAKTAKKIKKN